MENCSRPSSIVWFARLTEYYGRPMSALYGEAGSKIDRSPDLIMNLLLYIVQMISRIVLNYKMFGIINSCAQNNYLHRRQQDRLR